MNNKLNKSKCKYPVGMKWKYDPKQALMCGLHLLLQTLFEWLLLFLKHDNGQRLGSQQLTISLYLKIIYYWLISNHGG